MQKRNNPLELRVKEPDAQETYLPGDPDNVAPLSEVIGDSLDNGLETATYSAGMSSASTGDGAKLDNEGAEPPLIIEDAIISAGTDDTDKDSEGYSEESGNADENAIKQYQLAVRFNFSGNIDRKFVLVRLSGDLCRLAKNMHPTKKLNRIIENALLTRIYLENRDAFDNLDLRIEEKGGHIKC